MEIAQGSFKRGHLYPLPVKAANELYFREQLKASTPADGSWKLYFTSEGLVVLDSNGKETVVMDVSGTPLPLLDALLAAYNWQPDHFYYSIEESSNIPPALPADGVAWGDTAIHFNLWDGYHLYRPEILYADEQSGTWAVHSIISTPKKEPEEPFLTGFDGLALIFSQGVLNMRGGLSRANSALNSTLFGGALQTWFLGQVKLWHPAYIAGALPLTREDHLTALNNFFLDLIAYVDVSAQGPAPISTAYGTDLDFLAVPMALVLDWIDQNIGSLPTNQSAYGLKGYMGEFLKQYFEQFRRDWNAYLNADWRFVEVNSGNETALIAVVESLWNSVMPW